MQDCKVCGKPRSSFIMNNKTVCFRCDELLFDIEIECEEEKVLPETKNKKNVPEKQIRTLNVTKK